MDRVIMAKQMGDDVILMKVIDLIETNSELYETKTRTIPGDSERNEPNVDVYDTRLEISNKNILEAGISVEQFIAAIEYDKGQGFIVSAVVERLPDEKESENISDDVSVNQKESSVDIVFERLFERW